MKTRVLSADEPGALEQAVQVLQKGRTVAFPTDTVYGLGALAFEAEGIERLYAIKGRSQAKAIPVLLSAAGELGKVAERPSAQALKLAERFWPGPLTIVTRRHPSLPDAIAQDDTAGLRVPDHPMALALLRLAGPMAVTSANISDGANALTAEAVLAQLGGKVHLILDGGETPGGLPSTVVDCSRAELRILRAGPISREQILSALD